MAKILVIEDNEHMHRIYADKFRREGYQVLDAFNGEEGTALALRENPTVVLLDLMLPRVDGYEVLDKLRDDPSTKDIPVLVISNKCQPADIERALVLGARNFFHKGMTLLDDLALEIRKLCRLKKAIIVSSRPTVAEALSKQLSSLDYLSSTNTMVMELVPRVEREHPDVIFLDTQVAGLNFNMSLQRLQASAKAKSIPVVIVDNVPSGVMADNRQVVGQLSVPFEPASLVDVLKRCAPSEKQAVAA